MDSKPFTGRLMPSDHKKLQNLRNELQKIRKDTVSVSDALRLAIRLAPETATELRAAELQLLLSEQVSS